MTVMRLTCIPPNGTFIYIYRFINGTFIYMNMSKHFIFNSTILKLFYIVAAILR